MSFPSPVFTIPGASTEKLPYVHANFKPRTTFAKSFGGRRRYSKVTTSTTDVSGGRLPQITYNATDKRTLITFGSVKRGKCREYPGFLGHAKLLRRNTEHLAANYRKDGNRSKLVYKYGSLPELTPKSNVQGSKIGSHGEQSHIDEFLHNSLESLLFVGDDDADDGDDDAENEKTSSPGKLQTSKDDCNEYNLGTSKSPSRCPNVNSSTHDGHSDTLQKPTVQHSNSDSRRVHYNLPVDSVQEELEKKIKDARGKSGMKRGRRRESDRVRMLGDVITSERLTELLSPRKQETTLSFSSN